MNENLLKITELLNDGEYHDGTSIGNYLKITRTAVWKVIKKLQLYGVTITSSKNKGYRLEEPLILLDEQKIIQSLNSDNIVVEVLEKIDSTNQYLKTYLNENKSIRACIAEMQTSGRGRLNRHWHSPFGKNIYFSLLYPLQKDISALSGLSLIVSLALCRAVEIIVQKPEFLKIKWPNDMMVANEKIAGILIEIQGESNGFFQVIIGIGMNVNLQQVSSEEITQPWSSLKKLTGHYYDRNAICAELIRQLLLYLDRFTTLGLTSFMEEWQQRDLLFGNTVTVLSGKHTHSGIGAGIDGNGHLLLKMPDGDVQSFSSGDTTILKE